ncbi:MAG TPA: hypothetical protein VFF95_04040 [Candidatus Binatus sp.]|nr:hypothetical protein [Candidatus Binatus sp.]
MAWELLELEAKDVEEVKEVKDRNFSVTASSHLFEKPWSMIPEFGARTNIRVEAREVKEVEEVEEVKELEDRKGLNWVVHPFGERWGGT